MKFNLLQMGTKPIPERLNKIKKIMHQPQRIKIIFIKNTSNFIVPNKYFNSCSPF